MMRLCTPRHNRFQQATSFDINFGGGEANVSSSLSIMGIPASHVTRFPDNDLGHSAINAYKKHGVDTQHIVLGGERIGVYFVEQGVAMRPSKVIYDRAASSFATLLPDEFNWEVILQDAQWFHFTGITPAISASAAQACLDAVQAASRMGLMVSADVGYRSNLWKWGKRPKDVMPELIEYCDIIICSKSDASDMFNIVPTDEKKSFKSVCQQLNERFPKLKKVLSTKRGQISASHNTLIAKCWNGYEMLGTKLMDIPDIVDRIGGGDAFMAGFIYGELIYKDTQKALEFGVAASALKHTIEGDFNIASISEIESVMNGDVSGKIRR
jgi:2-dehydro-3-deoxygluconokinase